MTWLSIYLFYQVQKSGPVSVVDTLLIPNHLTPGKYVLGWRLDCEATAQIWSNCADLELVA